VSCDDLQRAAGCSRRETVTGEKTGKISFNWQFIGQNAINLNTKAQREREKRQTS
jgi:hypothetical protein